MPKWTDMPYGRSKKKDDDPVAPPPPPPDPDPAPPPEPEPTPGANGRLIIDPVTRIEGHLKIELEVRNGEVSSAWSSGTLFRGIETILRGRAPEDAWLFTQRLCGVCTYVHGSTSVRSVENALGITIPNNARLIRNLLMGSQYLHDHLVHFYHLHALDWVDITQAIAADPAAAADLAAPGAPSIDFTAARQRLADFVGAGQLGPFANAYWEHPEYLLSPEENLLLAAHYLEALKVQVKTARMHAIFGGKNPHVQSLRVGGVTCGRDITAGRMAEFGALLEETRRFIETVYLPDVKLLAGIYGEWAAVGGNDNFLAFGEFPDDNREPESLYLPRGVIVQKGPVVGVDTAAISEHVQHSWYQGSRDLHPSVGETVPGYTGYDTAARYSWLKAPRYGGLPMEVGPLARMLVAHKSGHGAVGAEIDAFLFDSGLNLLNPADPISAMFSTIGRTGARAIETKVIAEKMAQWLNQLTPGGGTVVSRAMPSAAKGVGFNEAPRGALGHWIDIQNQRIGNYQMVVPSTWNFGPRCANDLPGPVEKALVGVPVADPARPLEILRVVHSLDPCIACAVHVIDPRSDKTYQVRVL
jgi:[NiFe] hydrogenase large subunit